MIIICYLPVWSVMELPSAHWINNGGSFNSCDNFCCSIGSYKLKDLQYISKYLRGNILIRLNYIKEDILCTNKSDIKFHTNTTGGGFYIKVDYARIQLWLKVHCVPFLIMETDSSRWPITVSEMCHI